jgi:hypothetical protein
LLRSLIHLDFTFVQSDNYCCIFIFLYTGRQLFQHPLLKNKIEEPEMNPHTYGHLIFDKGTKTIQCVCGERASIFNKWCWFNWQSTCRRMQIDPFLIPVQSSSSNG